MDGQTKGRVRDFCSLTATFSCGQDIGDTICAHICSNWEQFVLKRPCSSSHKRSTRLTGGWRIRLADLEGGRQMADLSAEGNKWPTSKAEGKWLTSGWKANG